ncbi:hypothetical protein AXFE_23880 [Acidithrix ferrooxidans]|uniref:Uncharacterized protein n=1 Tax=Acidithrix ferrooxidans TaxID=1280514 RepID=A0A0D8HFL9_9ACTN|nr:hypothetical protein AXFE_23880 [Acidithrix ferrooxidans]
MPFCKQNLAHHSIRDLPFSVPSKLVRRPKQGSTNKDSLYSMTSLSTSHICNSIDPSIEHR